MGVMPARWETISTHAPAGGATMNRLRKESSASISTHAPAGGATAEGLGQGFSREIFLLTPLREGRQSARRSSWGNTQYFYSRPCGRGDGRQTPVW